MNSKDPYLLLNNPPIVQIPANQIWYRLQLKKTISRSVQVKGYILAPTGGLVNRFDLVNEPTAYLADSPETALYESLFRREVTSCHWDRLAQRELVSFETQKAISLVYLRGQEEQYPVLQSMRYESSQELAKNYREKGLDGILYASAQHPYHGCVCLFKTGMEKTKKLESYPLVEPKTKAIHKAVVIAQRGSQVPIIYEAK
jgi:hypothetical protein